MLVDGRGGQSGVRTRTWMVRRRAPVRIIHIGEFIVRRRVTHACLPAVLLALLAAPAASAATLSVDDDRKDCTAAGYASIQDAIDAAAPGDTIAICPGRYVEGNGAANSNALTVDKTLTLKGAGADLVTISPRRY